MPNGHVLGSGSDSPSNIEMILSEAFVRGSEYHIDLLHPDASPDHIKQFVVGLCDVRAADSIRISYDYDRDGYKIEQASIFEFDCDDTVCDEDWQEVAFIQAWKRKKE